VSPLRELAAGLHHWTARHPEWHPTADGFGAEVGSYAVVADDDLLLIDPLVLDDDATTAALDALAAASSNTYILITIGYHVRSAATLAARYGATVHGPPQAGRRLRGARFEHLPQGELRMWSNDRDEPSRRTFYRERFAPTLQPLVDLEPDHVLVTHGAPIVGDGAEALRAAAAAPVWFHAG
jgi:hypothetical protein